MSDEQNDYSKWSTLLGQCVWGTFCGWLGWELTEQWMGAALAGTIVLYLVGLQGTVGSIDKRLRESGL